MDTYITTKESHEIIVKEFNQYPYATSEDVIKKLDSKTLKVISDEITKVLISRGQSE